MIENGAPGKIEYEYEERGEKKPPTYQMPTEYVSPPPSAILQSAKPSSPPKSTTSPSMPRFYERASSVRSITTVHTLSVDHVTHRHTACSIASSSPIRATLADGRRTCAWLSSKIQCFDFRIGQMRGMRVRSTWRELWRLEGSRGGCRKS
jgi:hypothetical protein